MRAVNGVATFAASDFAADPASGLLEARVAFPPTPPRRRLAAAEPDATPEGRLLARLVARGAAGNHGDLYDNRDRDHSTLRHERHPRLTFAEYDESARRAGLDYGLNLRQRFDAITFGNSSTALTAGPMWRSQPRLALTTPGGPARLARLYRANHLYVYPEHRDHDPDRGDLFPAMTPFFVVSQGSSGSDQPFLRAIAGALAALRPEVKARLRAAGHVAPALQMLLRRSRKGVESDADYLSRRAHPTVFRAEDLDLERVIRQAAALTPETLPPVASIAVTQETAPAPRTGLFGDGLTERLFDTPDAVARVARGVPGLRRYLLRAEAEGPGAASARFVWRVLRGPGVSARPLAPDGSAAEITVPWVRPYAAPPAGEGASALETTRIDVAVFARTDAAISAPAFFSVTFPPDQARSHALEGRPLRIDYAPEGGAGRYADPALFPRRDWRDDYDYAEDGRLLGWTRRRADGSEARFTAQGLLVLEADASGRPTLAREVAYPVERSGAGRAVVRETPTDRRFALRYLGPEDHAGTVVPLP